MIQTQKFWDHICNYSLPSKLYNWGHALYSLHLRIQHDTLNTQNNRYYEELNGELKEPSKALKCWSIISAIKQLEIYFRIQTLWNFFSPKVNLLRSTLMFSLNPYLLRILLPHQQYICLKKTVLQLWHFSVILYYTKPIYIVLQKIFPLFTHYSKCENDIK